MNYTSLFTNQHQDTNQHHKEFNIVKLVACTKYISQNKSGVQTFAHVPKLYISQSERKLFNGMKFPIV